MTRQEYETKARELRNSPMVKAWIASAQTNRHPYEDCPHCSYPHASSLMCGGGASFGRLRIGRNWYYIDFSNVVFFHEFMLKLSKNRGFHWRDETFFKRADDGSVGIVYFEQYNNAPQEKAWRIPAAEWASIVCSVSREGETGERWNAAQDFHGRTDNSGEPGK